MLLSGVVRHRYLRLNRVGADSLHLMALRVSIRWVLMAVFAVVLAVVLLHLSVLLLNPVLATSLLIGELVSLFRAALPNASVLEIALVVPKIVADSETGAAANPVLHQSEGNCS